MTDSTPKLPRSAVLLGAAGLFPQLLALGVTFDEADRFVGLSAGFFYAALIFSFLGGVWWGVAAAHAHAPKWIYAAAVVPSLVAFATGVPWMTGGDWPGPSLYVLGLSILATPIVDWQLAKRALVPTGWMALRLTLSIGLGMATLLLAARA